jgi:hypothetical protein
MQTEHGSPAVVKFDRTHTKHRGKGWYNSLPCTPPVFLYAMWPGAHTVLKLRRAQVRAAVVGSKGGRIYRRDVEYCSMENTTQPTNSACGTPGRLHIR